MRMSKIAILFCFYEDKQTTYMLNYFITVIGVFNLF